MYLRIWTAFWNKAESLDQFLWLYNKPLHPNATPTTKNHFMPVQEMAFYHSYQTPPTNKTTATIDPTQCHTHIKLLEATPSRIIIKQTLKDTIHSRLHPLKKPCPQYRFHLMSHPQHILNERTSRPQPHATSPKHRHHTHQISPTNQTMPTSQITPNSTPIWKTPSSHTRTSHSFQHHNIDTTQTRLHPPTQPRP